MTLDVIIATLGADGIARAAAMELPQIDGVRYIVSWQRSEGVEVPPELVRADVTILRPGSIGLSRNRNNALDHSTADIRLIADDDLGYTPEALREVVATFERRPGLDIAFFKYEGSDGKTYPAEACDLAKGMPRGYYVTSFEMAVRNRGAAGALRYDERFGLGAGLPLGEEEELLWRARRMGGMEIWFFPVVITRHPGLTTGSRPITDSNALRATGAVIALHYPLSWPARIVLKAWRLSRRRQAPLLRALRYEFGGAVWRLHHY